MSFFSELFASLDARFHAIGAAEKALFLKIEGDIAQTQARVAALELVIKGQTQAPTQPADPAPATKNGK